MIIVVITMSIVISIAIPPILAVIVFGLVIIILHVRPPLPGGVVYGTATIDLKRPYQSHGGFQKIRGPFLGIPTTGIIVFLGLFWGPLFFETLK